jgi:cytosine deaminase
MGDFVSSNTAEPAIALLALGRRLLDECESGDSTLAALADLLKASPGYRTLDEAAGWLACVLALRAASLGNYGVGAILLDEDGRILEAGHNETFTPHFRSDAHAEMVVVSAFEARRPNLPKRRLTLYTSLEACPMCHVRLLSSGIGEIVHLADDPETGASGLAGGLPAYWRDMGANCRFRRAEAGDELRRLAKDIFASNLEALGRRLAKLG